MEHEEILQRTVRMLTRRAKWVRRRALLLNALFVGLCLCLAVAIWHRVVPLPINRLIEVSIGVMAICAVAALIAGLRSRADPLGLLIRADRTLRLKERLSTAYELARSPQPHPLRGLVLQEAARVARSVAR